MTNKSHIYRVILDHVQPRARGEPVLRVLELGAGISRFPESLATLQHKVEYVAHDIVDDYRAYYERIGHRFVTETSALESGSFDVVFCTYVLEHITRPESAFREVARLVKTSRLFFTVSPKYDLPVYIPPAIRHWPRRKIIAAKAILTLRWIAAAMGFPLDCVIVRDPAVFHRPFRRDYDAVHLVLEPVVRRALERWFEVETMKLPRTRFTERIRDRLLVCSLVCRRKSDPVHGQ